MVFFRFKKVKKWYYGYLVKSIWDKQKKSPRQVVVKYLGRAHSNNKLPEFKLDKCVFCGSTENLTVDHIKPLSKAGLHNVENLQCLCMCCNQRKGVKELFEVSTIC